MRNTRHFIAAVAGLVLASITPRPVPASDPFFVGLGDVPGGLTRSVAYGLSADGSTVVGDSNAADGQHAYVWRMDTGMRDLGLGFALDASADGSVVAGVRSLGNTGQWDGFRWTQETGFIATGLPILFHGQGISDDGSVIAGHGADGAARWTEATGTIPLGTLYPGRSTSASDVSSDGLVIVGSQESAASQAVEIAFRWTESTGIRLLGTLPGAAASVAQATNADGSVVVGFTGFGFFEAFRWTPSEGMVGLGDLPGGEYSSSALDVTPDGSLIVGFSATQLGFEPFVWDAVNGMRNLKSILIEEGLELTGWRLTHAWGVSADGRTFAGNGVNPLGNEEAWIASLGRSTLPGDYNANGLVEQADLDLVLLNWGAQTPPIPTNWTSDLPSGLIDQQELDRVLLHWGNTSARALSLAGASASTAAVPEPAGLYLVLAGIGMWIRLRCRRVKKIVTLSSPT